LTYPEAITYLYSRLPVDYRIGPKAIKPGLGNIIRLCDALGNPQQQFRSLHVAGTNGKGSTAHLLASVYQSAGYRVGLYTSPHLKSFTERIRINGQPIPEEVVAQFVRTNKQLIEAIEPSFFEVTVALAFAYFSGQGRDTDHGPVDIAVIEVGLGGRLDSTNIITPDLSVITNIGWDHTETLGDTLEKIAAEKGGIIKPGVPVVVGETLPETQAVFAGIAAQQAAPIHWAEAMFSVVDAGLEAGQRRAIISQNPVATTENGAGAMATDATRHTWPDTFAVVCDLPGLYQLANLRTVLTAVDALQSRYPVSLEVLQLGVSSVVRQTRLKGRWQQLTPSGQSPSHHPPPLVVADTAHNQPGLVALLETVRSIPHRQLHIILGLVADKDRSRVLSVLPSTARYYFCQAQLPRSLPAGDLQEEAATYNLIGDVFTDVNQALTAAISVAEPTDLVLVTGSNYVVAEIVNL
jgi:dihydrofolate synthase / folylpolyglutamate synthase